MHRMITLFTIHVTTNAMVTILGVAVCLCFIAWTGRGVGKHAEK